MDITFTTNEPTTGEVTYSPTSSTLTANTTIVADTLARYEDHIDEALQWYREAIEYATTINSHLSGVAEKRIREFP